MVPCLIALAALLQAPQQPLAQPAPLPAHPGAALAAAIDRPSRAERAAAADELGRREVPLAQWLAAARALRPAEGMAGVERVDAQTVRYGTRLWIAGIYREAEILVRTPPGAPAVGPQPLLFCWAGAGGSGATALQTWAPVADRCGLVLAAPTETYEQYRLEGWSYHPDAHEGLLAALRFVRRHHDIDEDRIFLAGSVGGGHMVWDIGQRHADRFAGLLPANGSPRLGNSANECNTIFLESIVGVPLRSLHWGPQEARQDENVRRAFALLQSFGGKHAERLEFRDEATALGEDGVPKAWFAARRQAPDRIVRLPELCWYPLSPDFGRAHWLDILRVDPDLKLPFPPPLPASSVRGLGARGQRDAIERRLREQHPRLEVTNRGQGRFDVEDRYIQAFRLLLTESMRGADGNVEVHWRGHTLQKPAVPSTAVFLRDFVERFDRTFLPVAEVKLP